jgi:TetR/AcrR family transcriptional repressor of nem operon
MYYHFESKDDLSVTLLERAAAEMKDSFTRGDGKSPTQHLEYYLNLCNPKE